MSVALVGGTRSQRSRDNGGYDGEVDREEGAQEVAPGYFRHALLGNAVGPDPKRHPEAGREDCDAYEVPFAQAIRKRR